MIFNKILEDITLQHKRFAMLKMVALHHIPTTFVYEIIMF